MNTHYLVKFEDNWADEMDVAGFALYPKDEWDNLKKAILNLNTKMIFSIGTNEDLRYSSGKQLLENIQETPITTEKYNILEELFNGGFGETSVFDNIDYYIKGNVLDLPEDEDYGFEED